MIPGHENITAPLTPDELNQVKPIINGFRINHVGKANMINSKEVVRKMKERGFKISGPRFRKIINYIRINSLAPIC